MNCLDRALEHIGLFLSVGKKRAKGKVVYNNFNANCTVARKIGLYMSENLRIMMVCPGFYKKFFCRDPKAK